MPPTPIWRAMVIRCYAMLSYMFPYLSCLSMIFTRILGNSPEQPPIRIITLFPCRGLVNPEHDPWKSRPKTVKRDWFAVTWAGSGKAVKAHRRVLCRDGPCFTFWNPLNGVWRLARRWQRTAAAGQRVRGDLGRQWQSGKGPQRGFVSWWAVLRARFETL